MYVLYCHQTLNFTTTTLKVELRKDGIVGHMIKMMDTYAKDLETLVGARTAELEETQKQADRLLNQLLPKFVIKCPAQLCLFYGIKT